MRHLLRYCFIALALVQGLPLAAASETERLVTLARVWSTAKFLHPYFLERQVKWDEALFRAIPKVRAAKSDAEFDGAVAAMLADLGDGATRVGIDGEPVAEGTAIDMVSVGALDGDTFVMRAGEAIEKGGAFGFRDLAEASAEEMAKARFIVIDLRTEKRNTMLWAISELAGSFTAETVEAPARWTVLHSGFVPEEGTTSGGYYSALTSLPGSRIEGSAPPELERVAFIVNADSPLPGAIVALRHAQRAVIVATSPLSADAFAETTSVPLGTGRSAIIRVSELALEVKADAVVTNSDREAAIARARDLVRIPLASSLKPRAIPTARYSRNDGYASITELPSVEMRLLAAFRMWGTIDRFYPYKHLIGDWDAAFARSIPKFIAASDRQAYVGAILELAAAVEDGHTTVYGAGIPAFFGPSFFPAEVRLVRGEMVATTVGAVAEKAGLRIGDVIRSVDGEPLRDRMQRLHKYVTASTETARANRVARYALRGAKDSVAQVEIERGGARRVLAVPRGSFNLGQPTATTPVYRMLKDGIGYADLTRLKSADVDPMFVALAAARSIIFDMRGYPNGTAWAIAPRLGRGEVRPAALFSRPQILGNATEEMTPSFTFAQPLPDGRSLKRYQGPTFMIIDDRAISQSEHTGLFLETANGTEFIGTPTSGANGDITRLALPGDLYLAFSGHEIRHANGDQLQRVGLKPSLLVEPTIAGLQSGKDELLDQAIAHVKKKLAK